MRYLETIKVLELKELKILRDKVNHSFETEPHKQEPDTIQESDLRNVPKEIILDYRFTYLREQLKHRKKRYVPIGFLDKVLHKHKG